MTFLMLVVLLEAAITACSGIDARCRSERERRSWLLRWFYWHLAPLWALWLGLVGLFVIAAQGVAERSAERSRHDASLDPVLVEA